MIESACLGVQKNYRSQRLDRQHRTNDGHKSSLLPCLIMLFTAQSLSIDACYHAMVINLSTARPPVLVVMIYASLA